MEVGYMGAKGLSVVARGDRRLCLAHLGHLDLLASIQDSSETPIHFLSVPPAGGVGEPKNPQKSVEIKKKKTGRVKRPASFSD